MTLECFDSVEWRAREEVCVAIDTLHECKVLSQTLMFNSNIYLILLLIHLSR